MNSLKQLAVVTILAALACAGLHAQSVEMRANIPFDFQAGNKLMPAGEYVIQSQSSWVILHATDGSKLTAVMMTNAATGADPTKDARLDFIRYGGAYFLTSIWNPYSADGRQVPQSTRERELAKRFGAPGKPVAVILASNK